MKVKDVIKNLQCLDPEQSIVHTYWEKDSFENIDIARGHNWEALCDIIDRKMDWSNAHEDIQATLEYAVDSVKEND
tara:strand:- start:907 stop:1134 length:228 start_codon:yes stop_codon:yes gene_type:complete